MSQLAAAQHSHTDRRSLPETSEPFRIKSFIFPVLKIEKEEKKYGKGRVSQDGNFERV